MEQGGGFRLVPGLIWRGVGDSKMVKDSDGNEDDDDDNLI